jgi:NCS1 family nucleobase:cation symporter-1
MGQSLKLGTSFSGCRLTTFKYHVGGFWIAEGFNVAQLETPSSAVALGLNPGLTIVACLIGNLLVTLPTMSSGYLGSKYGLNFPVISRSSFGMKGAYVAMVIRAVVCVIWYGVQSSVGGDAVRCMLEAIWPRLVFCNEVGGRRN